MNWFNWLIDGSTLASEPLACVVALYVAHVTRQTRRELQAVTDQLRIDVALIRAELADVQETLTRPRP